MAFRSVPRRFFDQAKVQPDAPAYALRRQGAWVTTDWLTFTRQVAETARALMGLGLEPGDKVAIMGPNVPSWTIVDLAAMSAGCVPVGVYTTCSPGQAAYILRHAEAKVVFAGGADAVAKVGAERDSLPDLQHVVRMPEFEDTETGGTPWDEFLRAAEPVEPSALESRIDAISEHDLGALIYTSGTTGPPKGSMLTHGNMAAASDMGRELLPDSFMGARHLSYLPMAHAAERALTVLGPVSFGYAVYYADSIDRMAENLKEVQPDLFLGVPRVWEKMHDGLLARLSLAKGGRARFITWARRIGLEVNTLRCDGEQPRGRLAWKYALAKRLLFAPIRKAVGLSRARVLISGAAPLSADVLRDLASLDLPVRELYGQTEDCGPTTNNRPGETRWGSVGRPFRGCEVRIADDSEILVRGANVFAGYFKEEDATSEVLKDGWLYSGDLGHFDQDGYLYITGRKKEILITAGGKNIAPRNLEEALKRSPLIEEAVVLGDRQKYLAALVTLRMGVTRNSLGIPDSADPDPRTWLGLADALWEHVQGINLEFSQVEQIKRIAVLRASLSVEAGELTPSLKLRRSMIADRHRDLIGRLYSADAPEVSFE